MALGLFGEKVIFEKGKKLVDKVLDISLSVKGTLSRLIIKIPIV